MGIHSMDVTPTRDVPTRCESLKISGEAWDVPTSRLIVLLFRLRSVAVVLHCPCKFLLERPCVQFLPIESDALAPLFVHARVNVIFQRCVQRVIFGLTHELQL